VGMVQVAVARDLTEAEEIQTILRTAGIPSELHPAVPQHPAALDDPPTQVLVPEESVDDAQDAIEAMTEPDDLLGDR
jgi:putative signal transducing protein